MLDANTGVIQWNVPDDIGGQNWPVRFKATQNSSVEGSPRSIIRQYYFKTNSSWGTAEANGVSEKSHEQVGAVAVADYFHVAVNNILEENVLFGYRPDRLGGNELHAGGTPEENYNQVTMTHTDPSHANTDGFTFDSSKEQTMGGFSYTPETNGEGLDSFTYSHSVGDYHYFDHGFACGSNDVCTYIQGSASNTADVIIAVGKAVRADIDIDLPAYTPDATQTVSSWHTYDAEADSPDENRAFLKVNDDDDNENRQEDRKELKGPVQGENDLIPVKLGYWLRDDATITDFKAKLLVSTENGGGDNIRIWDSPTKTKEIIPDKNLPGATQWVLDELPERVWVEGLEVGNASLSLRIEGATGALFTTDKTTPEGYQASTSDTDQVKFGVFGGNLTLEGVAEKDELHPGGFVFYNDNDSDESGILDLLEDVGRTTQDPDWLKLTVDPIAPLSLGGLYSLNFSGSVRIWHDNGNGTFSYITPEDYFSATDPPDFFVEGFSTDSEDNIRLDFVSTSGKTTQGLDKVKVKTSQVVVEWAKIKDQAGSDTFNEASGRLEEEKAKNKNKGAFILLNNDDDDYDGEKDSNNTLVLSNQENDLLPVYVKKMPRDTGNGDFTYSLRKGSKLPLMD